MDFFFFSLSMEVHHTQSFSEGLLLESPFLCCVSSGTFHAAPPQERLVTALFSRFAAFDWVQCEKDNQTN